MSNEMDKGETGEARGRWLLGSRTRERKRNPRCHKGSQESRAYLNSASYHQNQGGTISAHYELIWEMPIEEGRGLEFSVCKKGDIEDG